jgi:hypothetical protein
MARCCDPNRANREANPPTEVRERDRDGEDVLLATVRVDDDIPVQLGH